MERLGRGGSNEKHANNNHAAVFHVQEDGHLLHVQLDDGTVRAFLLAVDQFESSWIMNPRWVLHPPLQTAEYH